MTAAWERTGADWDAYGETEVDDYALESPAEFFAVLSEHFFTIPEHLQEVLPEAYALLASPSPEMAVFLKVLPILEALSQEFVERLEQRLSLKAACGMLHKQQRKDQGWVAIQHGSRPCKLCLSQLPRRCQYTRPFQQAQ